MKTILLILLGTLAAFGQSQMSLVLDPINPNPSAVGAPVILDVTLSDAPGPAGLQFSIPLPPGATATAQLFGAVTVGNNKQMPCSLLANVLTCLVEGPNAAPIIGLTFAHVSVIFPVAGTSQLGILNPVLAAPDGSATAVTAGPPVSVTLTGPPPPPPPPVNACDLNADGVVNAADITIAINQALGTVACTNADLVGNHTCTVIGVQRVINASMPGGVCRVGQ